MTDLLTAAGLIMAALLAYMQVQKQHRAGILLQREHLRDELRTKLYERVSNSAQKASRLIGRSKMEAMSFIWRFELRARRPEVPLSTTLEELGDTHLSGAQALSDLLVAMEQYEIAFLRFRKIRRVLAEEHGRSLEAHSALFAELSTYVPYRVVDTGPGSTALTFASPGSDDLAKIAQLTSDYTDVCGDLSSFLADLQVEMQNELLSHLFDGRIVPPRHPEDPTAVVLQRDADDLVERPKGRWV